MLWRTRLVPHEVTLALLALASVLGCASSHFDGHVYRDGDVRFRVGPVPNSWRPLELSGALLAYRDDAADATLALNGRCKLDGDDVPLTSLTQHLFLEFTGRTLVAQEEQSLDGRAALRTELSAELDGVKKQYLVYVLKKDGCVYDFMYVAAHTDPGSRAEFERFVRGFATLD